MSRQSLCLLVRLARFAGLLVASTKSVYTRVVSQFAGAVLLGAGVTSTIKSGVADLDAFIATPSEFCTNLSAHKLQLSGGQCSDQSTDHTVQILRALFDSLVSGLLCTEAPALLILESVSAYFMKLTAFTHLCRTTLIWLHVRLPPSAGPELPASSAILVPFELRVVNPLSTRVSAMK